MPLDRPIPAFYCCYLLRSTIRHSSVYVGSTPNPVRRLRQHNGLAKGGAVRTSRDSLRPWEMTCVVTGFPSHIAALQFEWAWQNPHITLHIPPESRIQHATQKKRSGQPKRPRHSVSSLLSNLHLLLRVRSFARWPLEVRFFSEDVHKAWLRWCKTVTEPLGKSINIIQDFSLGSSEGEHGSSPKKGERAASKGGFAALSVDYTAHKAYVEKSKSIFDFELEGTCLLCQKDLEHDAGLYAICPSPRCESVTHLKCLGKYFLGSDEISILPIHGQCPSCKTELKWVDVVKELSLRMRGQKEVERLLKVKKARNKKQGNSASQVIASSSDDENDTVDNEMEEEMEYLKDLGNSATPGGDRWNDIEDFDSSDTSSVSSSASLTKKPTVMKSNKIKGLRTVVEDSDGEDAIEL